MDLVPLIDQLGENGAAIAGGAVIGVVFGFFAQRTGFCTRSALLDVVRGRNFSALAVWLSGFAVTILGVQLLLQQDMLSVQETRFFSTAQSLSGAIVGGLLFGAGMVLARGCVSRLVVLGSSGNLRAIYSLAIVAAVGLATYSGFLVPLRDSIGSGWSSAAIGGNDLLAHFGLAQGYGVAIGIVLVLAALGVSLRARLSPLLVFGGAVVGLSVVAGWYFTHELSLQVFEPIQAESLSYIRPLATTAALLGSGDAAGLDQGVQVQARGIEVQLCRLRDLGRRKWVVAAAESRQHLCASFAQARLRGRAIARRLAAHFAPIMSPVFQSPRSERVTRPRRFRVTPGRHRR